MNLLVIPRPENSFLKTMYDFISGWLYQPAVYLTPTDLIFIEPARTTNIEPTAPPICERDIIDDDMYQRRN